MSFDSLKAEGAALLKAGDLAGAQAKYQQCLLPPFEPDDTQKGAVFSNLSLVCLKRKDFKGAESAAQQAKTHRPDWEKGYFRLGEVLFETNHFADAAVNYKKALELKPTDKIIKSRLHSAIEASTSRFYFRQLLPGRDICINAMGNPIAAQIFTAATQMKNFIYLIGDYKSKECFVIDACWDVAGILQVIEADKMTLAGSIATHYHFDHVGGKPPPPFDALGIKVPGLLEISKALKFGDPIYCHAEDAGAISRDVGIEKSRLTELQGGDGVIHVGCEKFVTIKTLHTPGHSPGSMVLFVDGKVTGQKHGNGAGLLISGDTIFPGSCGRLDLPDASIDRMFDSLARVAREINDAVDVYPGHAYSGNKSTIGNEKVNGLLKPFTKTQWMAMHQR
ncbi:tetratricopeptide repeat protein [bacterium]|nr:tetratricopeptide repeat protein [bacterium]